MSLHEQLARYVQENGISQKQLAAKAKITENALSLALNGKRKLLADEYVQICNALCVPYERFVQTRGNPQAS